MYITQVTLLQILRGPEKNCLRTDSGLWLAFRNTRTRYINECTPFIVPIKCTLLIGTYIKQTSPTCGTYVQSLGGKQCQLLKTKCYCEVVIYRLLGL